MSSLDRFSQVVAWSAIVVLAVAACGVTDGDETASTGPTSTQPTSSETAPPVADVTLLPTGLGVVSFGEAADTALPLLEQALGRQPTSDRTETGDLPGGYGGRNTTVRFVDFNGLSLVFTSWPYYRDDGVVHLIAWGASGTGAGELSTPEGIRPGSTVDDLRAAYGDQLSLPDEPDECTGLWHFFVGPTINGLHGTLDGPASDPATSVTTIGAGAQSTC